MEEPVHTPTFASILYGMGTSGHLYLVNLESGKFIAFRFRLASRDSASRFAKNTSSFSSLSRISLTLSFDFKQTKIYLNNRYQFVECDGVQSSMPPISSGVPQGSILGLFIIYINDFPNASRLFNFIMYDDDTTLSCTISRSVNPNENVEFECRSNK